eukprot:jgi/Picsp_1/1754/NSC_05226-R1_---NA---
MDDKTRKELAEAGRRKLEEFRRRKLQQESGGGDAAAAASTTAAVVVEAKKQEEEKDVVVKASVEFPGATAIVMMEDQSSGGKEEDKNETGEARQRVVDDDSDVTTSSSTRYKVLDDAPVFSKDGGQEGGSNTNGWTVTGGNDSIGTSCKNVEINESVMPTSLNVSSSLNPPSSKNIAITAAKDEFIGSNQSPKQGAGEKILGTAPGFHATDYLIPVVRGGLVATYKEEEEEEAVMQEIDANENAMENKSGDGFETGVETKKEEVSSSNKNDVPLSDPREQNARRKEFERLEEHIDKLTSEKIDLSLCLEKQTELVHRITDENETMIRRLNEASSQQERLMDQLGEYEKDKTSMQSLIQEYSMKLETKEKEAKDFETKMRVLGNELVRLEEDLLREKNERLRISSLSSNQEMENSKEAAAAWEKERFILESQREQMKRALDALQGSLAEAEAKVAEYEEQQRPVSGHEEEARKIPPLPDSAIVAAQAMREHHDGSDTTSSLTAKNNMDTRHRNPSN